MFGLPVKKNAGKFGQIKQPQTRKGRNASNGEKRHVGVPHPVSWENWPTTGGGRAKKRTDLNNKEVPGALVSGSAANHEEGGIIGEREPHPLEDYLFGEGRQKRCRKRGKGKSQSKSKQNNKGEEKRDMQKTGIVLPFFERVNLPPI